MAVMASTICVQRRVCVCAFVQWHYEVVLLHGGQHHLQQHHVHVIAILHHYVIV
jgi:hypothetical protein